jgi:hypothetical protein
VLLDYKYLETSSEVRGQGWWRLSNAEAQNQPRQRISFRLLKISSLVVIISLLLRD